MEGPRNPRQSEPDEIKKEDWDKVVGFLRAVKDLQRDEQRARLEAELQKDGDESYKKALTERFETVFGEAYEGEFNTRTQDAPVTEPGAATEEDLDQTIQTAQQRKEEIKKKRDDLRDSLTERYGKRGQRVEGTRGSFWLDPEDKAHIVRGDGREQVISVNDYNNFGNRTNPEWRKWLGSSAGGWLAVSSEEGQEAYKRRQTGQTIREAVENATPTPSEAIVNESREEREARLKRELEELEGAAAAVAAAPAPVVAAAPVAAPAAIVAAPVTPAAPRPIFAPRAAPGTPAAPAGPAAIAAAPAAPIAATAPAPAAAPAIAAAPAAAPAAPAAPHRNVMRRFVDWVRGRNDNDIPDSLRTWVNEPMRVPNGRSRIGHLMDTWRMTREQAERLNTAHKVLEMQRKLHFKDAINVTEMAKEKLYWASKMKRWPKWSALGTSAALIAAHSAKTAGLVALGSMIGIAAPAVVGTIAAAYSYKTNRNLKSSLIRGVLAGSASYLIGEYASKWVMNYFGVSGTSAPSIYTEGGLPVPPQTPEFAQAQSPSGLVLDPSRTGPSVPFSPNPNLEMSTPYDNSITTPKYAWNVPADPNLEMSTPSKTLTEIPTGPKVAESVPQAPSAEPKLPPLEQFPDPVNNPPPPAPAGAKTNIPDLKSNPAEPPVGVQASGPKVGPYATDSGLPPAPPPDSIGSITSTEVPTTAASLSGVDTASTVSSTAEKALRDATYTVLEGSAADTQGLDGWMKEYFFDSIGKNNLDERSKLQFIDAMRRVFTENPAYADFFFHASNRVVEGANGLDLQFNAGDKLDMRILSSPDFKEDLYHTIVQKERILTRAIGGSEEVAKLLRLPR